MNRRTLLAWPLPARCFNRTAHPDKDARAVKAIAFDGFTVFDPRPIAARVEEIFPGKGMEFTRRVAHAPVRIHVAANADGGLCRFLEGDRRCARIYRKDAETRPVRTAAAAPHAWFP